MNSIEFETLLVFIFVLIDNWYQSEGKAFGSDLPEASPTMSDSDILTLALILDYLTFPGESQFNRCLRKLGGMFKILRRK